MRLNPLKLGLASGILWSLGIFFMTLISKYTGWGMYWLSQWMDVYIGYNFSILGAFIGLIWAFIDGFVTLFLFGWLYNLLNPEN